LIGIVIGLAIAVVTAVFVTRTSMPFIGSAAKPAATAAAAPPTAAAPEAPKPQVPVESGALPDPNRTAASRPRPAPGMAPMERREIPTITAAPPTAPAPVAAPPAAPMTPGQAPIRAATPSQPPAGAPPAPQAAAASSDKAATYLLQAGAFRGASDADAMKLRLALMGMEAQIVTA